MKKSILSRLRTLLVLSLALVLVLSLTGCFQKEDPDPTGDTEDPTSQVDPTNADPTDTPTEEPTEAPTEAPQPSVMGTVSANNLNLRSNPTASGGSTVIGQLPVNLRVEIVEQTVEVKQKSDGTTEDILWGRIGAITLPSGTKLNGGWIQMRYVKLDGETTTDPVDPTTGSDNTTVSGTGKKGTITASELNIRKSTSTSSDRVGTYIKGDTVEILEQKSVDGINWGRTNKGWISMKYVNLNGTVTTTPDDNDDDNSTTSSEVVSDGKTSALGYGVVDLGALNVRTGPGTKYDKVGTVTEGQRFAYYQKSGNWVRIKDGWVSTSYFYIEGTTASDGGTGTVTATELNLRSGPDSSYKSNGVLKQGDTVKILAQANGWGYTSNGWVSMKYIKLDTESSSSSYKTGIYVVNTDLNIRKAADKDSERVGSYKAGTRLDILKVDGDWGQTADGWVNMNYLTIESGSSITTTTYNTGICTVTASSLRIRKEPSTSADTNGSYQKGTRLDILKVDGDWGQTADGWVNLKHVKYD